MTDGFRLSARWVVHTVGPIWNGGGRGEAGLLRSCYVRSIEVAAGVGATSMAFPAISTGLYGYPKDEAAAIAVDAVRSTAPAHGMTLVRFVCFSAGDLERYERLLA